MVYCAEWLACSDHRSYQAERAHLLVSVILSKGKETERTEAVAVIPDSNIWLVDWIHKRVREVASRIVLAGSSSCAHPAICTSAQSMENPGGNGILTTSSRSRYRQRPRTHTVYAPASWLWREILASRAPSHADRDSRPEQMERRILASRPRVDCVHPLLHQQARTPSYHARPRPLRIPN